MPSRHRPPDPSRVLHVLHTPHAPSGTEHGGFEGSFRIRRKPPEPAFVACKTRFVGPKAGSELGPKRVQLVFFSHFLSESWSEARKRSGSGCKSTTTSLSFPRAFWFGSCFEPAMQRRPDPALLYGHRVRRIHHEGCLYFDTDDILEKVLGRKTRDRKR